MEPPVDPRCARSWRNPVEKAKCEFFALLCVFIPHPYNHKSEKAITVFLMVTWVTWSLGRESEFFEPGPEVIYWFTIYDLFSFVVIYIFARMHDVELERLSELAGVDISIDTADPEEREDDDE